MSSLIVESVKEKWEHKPVLPCEVVYWLNPHREGHYLDGTVGLGGHSAAILHSVAGEAEICGLDRDPLALELAKERLSTYSDRVHLFHRRYSEFAAALDELGWEKLDGALLDLGVSSMQLDFADRGFSFYADGPLDMRMNQEGAEISAREWIRRVHFDELKHVIEVYGEDPQAGRIARAIICAREHEPLTTTGQLACVVERAYPPSWRRRALNHPATRTFQAIRMVVNDEAGELKRFLDTILSRLKPGARVAVISFHSIEDRVVKRRMQHWAASCICPAHINRCVCGHSPKAKILTKKPVRPNEGEIAQNPRSASARLRVAEKLP